MENLFETEEQRQKREAELLASIQPQSAPLSQPSTFTPTQPSSEELKAKLYEQLVQRMNGEGSDQEAIRKATEEAKPDLAQKLLQGLATFSTVAAGKQAPDYLKMNKDILEKKLAPIKEKQKSQSQAIDDAIKLYGLSREDAQLKLQQDKYEEDKKRYASEALSREADLKVKNAQIKNMGMESGLKSQESELKKLEIASKKAGANANDPNSAISGLYKIEAMKRGFKAEDVKNLSAAEIKPFIEQKLEEQKVTNAQQAKGQLSATETLKVAEGKAIPDTLDVIEKSLENNKDLLAGTTFKPWAKMSAAVRSNTGEKEQIFDAELRSASQQFGRYMEGGVLRKEDEDKYRLMFPQLSDTEAVAKAKLQNVREMMMRKQQTDLDALKAQGKSTAGLEFSKKAVSNAGKVVNVGGKKFKVAEDGDTLIPME